MYVEVESPLCSECKAELGYREKVDYDGDLATVSMEVTPCQACIDAMADEVSTPGNAALRGGAQGLLDALSEMLRVEQCYQGSVYVSKAGALHEERARAQARAAIERAGGK